jgi:hypothetical protein
MERLTVTLELQGHRFPFALCHRSLELGPAGPVSYYWMDGRGFRRRPPGPNFRSCVDHWWAAMGSCGAAGEIDTLVNRVWAECYPLVATARSLQDVYLDAHLAADLEAESAPIGRGRRSVRLSGRPSLVSAEEVRRLRGLARARDQALVREELERLFLGQLPPPEEMSAFQEAAGVWIGNGVVALKRGGTDALAGYVATVGQWMARFRRRGGEARVRRFVNLFAYESKAAFYTCVANAWIDLIPWLREHRGLDAISERLLRLWHHQNRPVEDDGTGPGGHRDAFCGQVLSLHPLSAFVMNDAVHLQALGGWLGHPDHDRQGEQGAVGDCEAYWELVATILVAAHEYRLARDRWDQTRVTRIIPGSGDRAAEAVGDEDGPSMALALEDYAAECGTTCPSCAGAARVAGAEPDSLGGESSRIEYRCRACGHRFHGDVSVAGFEAWLRGRDDD